MSLHMNVLTGKAQLPFCHLERQEKAVDKGHLGLYILQTYTPGVIKGLPLQF